MAWIALFAAGLFEIAWSVGLKQSQGFSRLVPSAFTLATMIASFTLLSVAMRILPLGTVYSVWTGIGAVGAAIFGIVWFGEQASPARLICLGLIIAGVVGLRLTAKA